MLNLLKGAVAAAVTLSLLVGAGYAVVWYAEQVSTLVFVATLAFVFLTLMFASFEWDNG